MSVQKEWREEQENAEENGISIPPPPVQLTDAALDKFIKMLRKKHQPIAKYFDKKGVGEKLLTEDSQLMERILLHFAERGIAVLPIRTIPPSFIEVSKEQGQLKGL